MNLKMLIQILSDPENQPHQYVGDTDGLLNDLMGTYEISDLKSDSAYAVWLDKEVLFLLGKIDDFTNKLREMKSGRCD